MGRVASVVTRTIPTHVGRTAYEAMFLRHGADHPHARGENSGPAFVFPLGAGPSPRTWGELLPANQRDHYVRTIPTHVGRTLAETVARGNDTDHPHARGENATAAQPTGRECGPSPRTWGEPCFCLANSLWLRTIPTHVGRTRVKDEVPQPQPDHPHARGENACLNWNGGSFSGPSPRTWGEPPLPSKRRPIFRTIPTHVGRTSRMDPRRARSADHPHARGENRTNGPSSIVIYGPSPRTWGELKTQKANVKAGRTIPTHVGRTELAPF